MPSTLSFATALAMVLSVPLIASAEESAVIAGEGALPLQIDRSVEAQDRCAPSERPFVANFWAGADALDRSRFPTAFLTSPEGEPVVVTIRRGTERDSAFSDAFQARFDEAYLRDDPEGISATSLDVALEVQGCASWGGYRVSQVTAKVQGHVGFYRLDYDVTVLGETEAEGVSVAYSMERRGAFLQPGQEPRRDWLERFSEEHRTGLPELGQLNLSLTDPTHAFPALDGSEGLSMGLSISFRFLVLDDGLSQP